MSPTQLLNNDIKQCFSTFLNHGTFSPLKKSHGTPPTKMTFFTLMMTVQSLNVFILTLCETCVDAGIEERKVSHTPLKSQSLNNGKLIFFLTPIRCNSFFFTAHMTLSHGTLVCCGTVVEKH